MLLLGTQAHRQEVSSQQVKLHLNLQKLPIALFTAEVLLPVRSVAV